MIPVKTIMTQDVISVKADMPIYETMELFIRHKISGIPVVNADMKVVGILTEKDVLKLLMDRKFDVKATVGDYMKREVVCFTEEDSAISVCEFFIKNSLRRVPIVRDNKLVGIVSRRDIIELILEMRSKISDDRFS